MAQTTSHGAGAHGHHAPHGVKLNHEPTDIPLTGTTRAAIVTLLIILGVMALMYAAWGFFAWQLRRTDQPPPALAEKNYGSRLPTTPRLQSGPGDDLTRYRAAQDGKLSSYGWVDRNSGAVHIPIERAIALMAERASTIADPKAAEVPAAAAPAAGPPAAPATPAPAPTGSGPTGSGPRGSGH
jgi:hypothetical protein